MSTTPQSDRLSEMPLWRLLVLLADIEREIGTGSSTARLIARLVSERLRCHALQPRSAAAIGQGEAAHE